jgi:hypothetical protein
MLKVVHEPKPLVNRLFSKNIKLSTVSPIVAKMVRSFLVLSWRFSNVPNNVIKIAIGVPPIVNDQPFFQCNVLHRLSHLHFLQYKKIISSTVLSPIFLAFNKSAHGSSKQSVFFPNFSLVGILFIFWTPRFAYASI